MTVSLCACVRPRLVEDGTCSVCHLRCLGERTVEEDMELVEVLWLIGTGQRRPWHSKKAS